MATAYTDQSFLHYYYYTVYPVYDDLVLIQDQRRRPHTLTLTPVRSSNQTVFPVYNDSVLIQDQWPPQTNTASLIPTQGNTVTTK